MEDLPGLETVAALVAQAARRFHVLFEYAGFVVGFLLGGYPGSLRFFLARGANPGPRRSLEFQKIGAIVVLVGPLAG